MADTKISALTALVDPTGIEDIAINDAGTTKRGVSNVVLGPAIELTSAYTLVNQSAAQKCFNSPAGGAFTTKANTSYLFEAMISLTSMSGSSGSFGFAFLGTASITRQAWIAVAQKSAALATAATAQITFNTAANITLVTASTTTTGELWVRGILRMGTAGTLIPAISLGVAAAAVVGNDSWFTLRAIGSDTVQSAGNWA